VLKKTLQKLVHPSLSKQQRQSFTVSEVAVDWHELMVPAIYCSRQRTVGPAVQHADIPLHAAWCRS